MQGRITVADPSAQRTRLWAMADLATPMAIRVAATLRLADQIAQGVRTAPALAEATQTHPESLERLLRHLVTAGLLTRVEPDGQYALTALGEALRDDYPARLRPMLDVTSAIGRADLACVHLLHSIRTGEPAFPRQYGASFWDDLAADPARTASFDAQMGADVSSDAPAIAAAYEWGALGHIMDVGGGNGALLIHILQAHPGLRGTVFDLPDTAEAARRELAAAGLAERTGAVAGSFFEPIPPGAGGYLLSAILHDWDDASATAILRRCAEAAGTTGKVFIVEKIGGDGQTLRTGMDVRMLVYFAGRERSAADLAAMADACGLRVEAIHPAGPIAVVELAAS
jgi:hypothetical protein